MNTELLNRRQALSRLALLVGGAVIGAEAFLQGTPARAQTPGAGSGFSDADRALLDEIGDTIIPTTNTPGAKATGIGAFMIMMVNECYDAEHRSVFKAGLPQLEVACQAEFGRSFLACKPAQRTALLNKLDAEQQAHHLEKHKAAPEHYFRLMKQLTLLGYFTSEIGCTQALRHEEVPGAYRGDVPYKKGDRAWYVPPSP